MFELFSFEWVFCAAESSQNILVGPRVTSIRQRSRSGESSPIGLSQNDMSHLNPAVSNILAGNALSSLIRSSSDSSILLIADKGLLITIIF